MQRIWLMMAVIIGTLGCKPELPPLEYRSERARVGSDVVDQVCAGTLARIDRELEQVEERLDLPRTDRVVDVYILEDAVARSHCPDDWPNCVNASNSVIITASHFNNVIAHELVHARLRPEFSDAARSMPVLFNEGVAVAIAPSYCPRPLSPELTADELLSARSARDLLQLQGYYLGGELVAGLLDTHDPAELLAFMAEVDRADHPSEVRRKYREHFGSAIDDDIFAHLREPEGITPEELGCFGPRAPASPNGTRFTLQAELDCDAKNVENIYGLKGGGYVEWILALDEASAGTYALVGEVPEWTSLTIEDCRCRAFGKQEIMPQNLRELQPITAGTYRLRWFGQLDSGASLDVELVRQ
jgi:hypothetical protein